MRRPRHSANTCTKMKACCCVVVRVCACFTRSRHCPAPSTVLRTCWSGTGKKEEIQKAERQGGVHQVEFLSHALFTFRK
jgi:hypothetical protein